MQKDQLTITLVAHNLTSLFYPFIEAIYSTLPLGCKYLVADCDSEDDTVAVLQEIAKYVPLEIIKQRWRHETGGTAIGIATHELNQASPTEHSYQLQACEILCDDGIEAINRWFAIRPQMLGFNFRHFWGDFKFDGTTGGRAYGRTWRILNKGQIMDQGDGYMPADPPGDAPMEGTIHRYAYCFDNQVKAKAVNHYHLYKINVQNPQARWESTEWCKVNSNYYGPYPACVHHLLDKRNYDVQFSLDWFKNQLTTK